MNIHVGANVLVLEVRHYQGILMQIPKINNNQYLFSIQKISELEISVNICQIKIF